jgi:hypothetical protein
MMPKLENKLHNHPIMEKKLGLNYDHVIIDREVFEELKYMQYKNNGYINIKESE